MTHYPPHEPAFLTIPRWLWRLVVPALTVTVMWMALLVIPSVTAVVLAGIGAVSYIATTSETAVQYPVPSPPPTPVSVLPAPTPAPAWEGTMEQTCTAADISGAVWGSDVYTSDSSLCAAAVHAGVIDQNGGKVVATKTAGCDSYAGTTRNGITTSSWGSYQTSFYFPSTSDGGCKATGSGGLQLFE